MTNKTEDKSQTPDQNPDEAKTERLLSEAKGLKNQGFSNEQIAQQLSSKHAKSAAEITALLDENKEDDK